MCHTSRETFSTRSSKNMMTVPGGGGEPIQERGIVVPCAPPNEASAKEEIQEMETMWPSTAGRSNEDSKNEGGSGAVRHDGGGRESRRRRKHRDRHATRYV